MSQPAFHITRRFNTPLHKVWQAFTSAAGLTAWMGPAGTHVNCLHLEPSTGGYLHYCLTSDADEAFFGRWDFLAVAPFQQLQYTLAFSDANGSCIRHPLAPDWPLKTRVQVTFVAEPNSTVIEVSAQPDPASSSAEITFFAAALEQLAQNWQEAFAALDQYFTSPSPTTITPCLWFNGDAEQALSVYAGLFPDSTINSIQQEQQLNTAEAGGAMRIEFTLAGQRFFAINGAQDKSANSALSITCSNPALLDTYRKALTGESEIHTGDWLTDRFGIRWQLSLLQP
jgi:predicted 3-demethylubiquinone-9 3-methyltransferase (glyoxalase superfamily)/uncharacterized protein YndB with AHSA1/START domain